MHQSLLLLLFNIIPIWIVVIAFRVTAVPLKTDIPNKFGTILFVYGILIPAFPLLLDLWCHGIPLRELFLCLLGEKKLLDVRPDPMDWIWFFSLYYFGVILVALGLAWLYKKCLPRWKTPCLNKLRTWINQAFDTFDIVDETQVLILQNEGLMQLDVLQHRYVYCGIATKDALSGLFGSRSITLKEVNRLHISNAKTNPKNNQDLKEIEGCLHLDEMVFPLSKIVNFNVRRRVIVDPENDLFELVKKSVVSAAAKEAAQ